MAIAPINAAIQSPADAVNAALVRIGHQLRIGTLYDGSMAAKRALDIYAQTRDQMLRDGDWHFAERDTTLTLLKAAPAAGYIPPTVWSLALYPPLPWQYEYQWPSDCLKVRAVKPTPLFLPNFDPKPHSFATPNDNSYIPAIKVICCNVASAILTYTGQITDPTTWEPSFAEVFIAALARRLVPALADPRLLQTEAQDEAIEGGEAMSVEE